MISRNIYEITVTLISRLFYLIFVSRTAPDPRFLCQTSSIDFLVAQNFDFNKLFKEGISYLRPHDEARIRDIISERQASRKVDKNASFNATPNAGMAIVPEEQKDFVNNVHEKVENWLKTPTKNDEDKKMMLDSCSPFQRRLIYSTVKPRFSDEFSFHMETVVSPKNDRDR